MFGPEKASRVIGFPIEEAFEIYKVISKLQSPEEI